MNEQWNFEGGGDDRRRRPSLPSVIALGILTAAVLGSVFFSFGDKGTPMLPISKLLEGAQGTDAPQTPDAQGTGALAEEDGEPSENARPKGPLDVTDVVEAAMPSVVAITNETVQVIESYFYGRQEFSDSSAGSGILFRQNEDELLIATNYHVVKDADAITVCFSVAEEYEADAVAAARLKGVDAVRDLAVVAVRTADVPETIRSMIRTASLGESGKLRVGDRAIAIGNAMGYGQSVTQGCVSAVNRSLNVGRVKQDFVQTDAAINLGNSGGALLNGAGEVIGVNSAKAANSSAEGMGYAIPIDEAKPFLEEMAGASARELADEARTGNLGLEARDVSREAMEHYRMPVGAFVYELSADGAAANAGLKTGDVILRLDGNRVGDSASLEDILRYYEAGETVELRCAVNDGESWREQNVTVTLEEPAGVDASGGGYSPFSPFDFWW